MKRFCIQVFAVILAVMVAQTATAQTYRILFDNSKSQTAGNADWKIDDNEPYPSPASPTAETDWLGGISAWGYELWTTGNYQIVQLPAGGTITFGDTADTDLSNFDVFVCVEPNNAFSAAEKAAILDFVEAGGGLFCVADHTGSDRDSDGIDSPAVWNDLFNNNPRTVANIFGVTFNLNSLSASYTDIRTPATLPEDTALFSGSFGSVTGIAYHAGASMTVSTLANPDARGQIWTSSSQSDSEVVLATSRFGSGRIAFVGDSSPCDDGTGDPGDTLYDGWNEAGVTDREIFLNLTEWLAQGGTGSGISISQPVLDPDPVVSNTVETVSCEITDDGTITGATLYYRALTDASFTTVTMTNTSGNTWEGQIPGHENTMVLYRVTATDNDTNTASTSLYSYQLGTVSICSLRTGANDADGVNRNNGLTVTVSGTVTAPTLNCYGSSGQTDIYIQDTSGCGINIYNNGSDAPQVIVGDTVSVTGTVTQYNGKLELLVGSTGTSMTVTGTAVTPDPTIITCSQVGEAYEGMLLRINGVTVASGTIPAAGSSGPITVQDGTGQATLYIDRDGSIDGTSTPSGTFDVIGIGMQYDNSSPFTDGYQVNPRFVSDLITGSGPTTYDLTTSVAAGSGTVSPAGTNSYSDGTVVDVTATAGAGYVFDHWGGDASGSTNPVSVTMDGNKSVTAYFVAGGSGGTGDLFISEYVEGSSNNKALEFYNGSGTAIDLAAGNYTVEFYSNGGTSPSFTQALTGTVADGDVHVLANPSAGATLLALADQTSSGTNWFNGNDAVVLKKDGTIIDSIGQVGFDPGSEWGTGDISTQNNTIRRLPTVCQGDPIADDAFDPSLEWEGFAQDTFDGLGSHTADCASGELFISEYVEGSSNNKALEFYNGTGAAIDLAAGNYTVEFYSNGGTSPSFTQALTGTVADGDVHVLANPSAGATLLALADQTSSATNWFNGNDAVVLKKDGTIIDSIGQVGFDPGTEWGTGDISTQNNTIRRLPSVCQGDPIADDAFDPSIEWEGFAQDTFDGLGSHTANCGGSAGFELLMTEIVVTPTGGEFIEIYNPGSDPVDLSDVYLTDATFAGGSTYYYNIVTGANAGGGGFGDFLARFPDGASIAAGEYQTIAIAGSDAFFAEYGINPTYELFEDGGTPDAIPDMREGLPGSINNQGGLTNSGEVAILFYWDGSSDLVQDLDYVVWGDKAEAVDKSSVSIDGPDTDSDTATFLNDTAIATQAVVSTAAHAFGTSWQRVDVTEGTETKTGGNGLTGHDETSEDLNNTWTEATPTPGAETVTTPTGSWVINELLADPDAAAGDANGDGSVNTSQDEFVELVNMTGADVDISGWTIADAVAVRHTFPSGTVITDGCAIVIFGGGNPTGDFGGATVQTASGGFLGLNNGGDTVTLNDGTSDVATVTYGSEGGNNESLTLDPDLTGTWVQHSGATGSTGALFSPGTMIDGTAFCVPTPLVLGFVINEFQADPDTTLGDANGDGVANFSNDEFVEIVNMSGSDADMSGWTLADGAMVRHTFPAGTVIEDGCAIVIFGGGTPTGEFGGATVQTASSGSLGLNNGGDTITLSDGTDSVVVSYGSEGGQNQSLTLDPDLTGASYVLHSIATNSGATLFSPGTLVDGSYFCGYAPVEGWILNELLADPAGDIAGDANGDGTRNSSEDEFVEFINMTGFDADISGWTVSDGVSVRHVFPADTYVLNGCSIVVFGGGTPTGTFGNATVQTASTGSLGLNNSGDTVTLNNGNEDVATHTYGSEAGDNQSITLDPDIVGTAYVKHSLATGSGGSLYSPGMMVDGTQICFDTGAPTLVDCNGNMGVFSGEAGMHAVTASDADNGIVAMSLDVDPVPATGSITLANFISSIAGETATADVMVTADVPEGIYTVLVMATNDASPDPGQGACQMTVSVSSPVTIPEIQGNGLVSPLDGTFVRTLGNIVTALAPNGFYMQDPTGDGNPDTSDGIFVYTGAAPTVLIGDEVNVDGEIVEYFEMTEFSGSVAVTVVSPDNPLPAPVTLNGTDPSGAQPQTGLELERYESMLVAIPDGTTCTGTDGYGDIMITANSTRAMREPGIEYPGLPALPVWDGNPEIFEMNPDGLFGMANLDIPGGVGFSATGVIAYSFGDYQLHPTVLVVDPYVYPQAVTAPGIGDFRIATQNMYRLFDTIDNGATDEPVLTAQDYADRLEKASRLIRETLQAPDILGVQEVETLVVLTDLANRIALDDPTVQYTPYLFEGNDIGGIDIGFLVRDSVTVDSVIQVHAADTFNFNAFDYTLHDRPPLYLQGIYTAYGVDMPISVLLTHNRSLSGIDGSNAEFVKTKRRNQAEDIAQYIESLQTGTPDLNLVVLGDFNAYEFTDGYVDVTGIMKGFLDPAGAEYPGTDYITSDLVDQTLNLPASQRYSYVQNGSGQALDHILTSQSLDPFVTGIAFGRACADAPAGSYGNPSTPVGYSDHDGMVLTLRDEAALYKTVTFLAGANGSLSGTTTQSIFWGDDCTPVEAIPDTGYHLESWTGDLTSTDNPLTVTNVTDHMTITAEFAINMYPIIATSGTGGSITPYGETLAPHGSELTFAITPNPGYKVSQLLVDGVDRGERHFFTFFVITQAHTIHATFEPDIPPVIDTLTADTTSGNAPLVVTFTAEAHDPDGGEIRRYRWYVSGRTSNQTFTYQPSIAYPFVLPGEYDMTLIVVDDEGTESEPWTIHVSVDELSPVGIPLPTAVDFAAMKAKTGLTPTTRIFNVYDEAATIQLDALAPDGQILATDTIVVPPTGSTLLDVGIFNAIEFDSVKATADRYVLALASVSSDQAAMTAMIDTTFTHTLTVPHIAESTDHWDTYAFISNHRPDMLEGEFGGETVALETSLSKYYDMENYLPASPETAISWGTISAYAGNPFSSTETITGFELFMKTGSDGAGVELMREPSTSLYIPHVPDNTNIFWTGFALVNPMDDPADITIHWYTDSGQALGTSDLVLPGKSKLKGLMTDMFTEYAGTAQWGILQSSTKLFGLELYGTHDAGICGLALPTAANSYGVLADVKTGENDWTGIVLTNVNPDAVTVTIALVGADGTVKAERTETIDPYNRFKAVVADYFSDATLAAGDYVRYIATGPIVALEAGGDMDRTVMTALTGSR